MRDFLEIEFISDRRSAIGGKQKKGVYKSRGSDEGGNKASVLLEGRELRGGQK